jgi:hypothetical protein
MADMCCDRVLRRGHRLAAGARRGYRFIREVKRTKVEATPDDASAYRQQAATAFDADLTDIARRFHGAARLRSVRSGHDDRRARSTGRAGARDPFRPRWGSFRQTGRRMNAPCCDGSAGRAAVLTSAREGASVVSCDLKVDSAEAAVQVVHERVERWSRCTPAVSATRPDASRWSTKAPSIVIGDRAATLIRCALLRGGHLVKFRRSGPIGPGAGRLRSGFTRDCEDPNHFAGRESSSQPNVSIDRTERDLP